MLSTCPISIQVKLTGKPRKYVSGKDLILHLIGLIGVDGALYKSLEFTGPGVAELTMDDLDVIELNEAFAAQALACIRETAGDRPVLLVTHDAADAAGSPVVTL